MDAVAAASAAAVAVVAAVPHGLDCDVLWLLCGHGNESSGAGVGFGAGCTDAYCWNDVVFPVY